MHVTQNHNIIQDLQAHEVFTDNTHQKTKNNLHVSKCNVQQLKKTEIAFIAIVTKKEGIIKYLQSQFNKYIHNNARHLFTAYNTT